MSLAAAAGSTPSLADFDALMQQIQFAPGAADGLRTVTWAAHEAGNVTSPTVTTTIDVGPVINSFGLTVGQGDTEPVAASNFILTHTSDSDFYSLTPGSVEGGVFEVTSDGVHWVTAPTGGPPFSIAEVDINHVRFHQDGTLTVPDFAISISDGNGEVSPAIAPNITLKIDFATSETVTFGGSSGTLLLDDPSSFAGKIAGISGTGDVLDLHGFDPLHTTATTGSGSYDGSTYTTLTVTDSSATPHSETFQLVGDYSHSSWTASDDLHGGADIVDPPATDGSPGTPVGPMIMQDPGPAGSQTIVASAPNQILTGAAAGDTFVFNFTGVGQDTVTNFHPTTDTLQFASPIFANGQAALNATQDDGHGNTVISLDAHDTITLSGILKAQLHVSDFHVA